MEKVKYITKKTRIVTVVINVKDEEYRYGISKNNNPNVRNWVVKDDDEAKEFVEQSVLEIKNVHEKIHGEGAIKSKRNGNHYRVFFGDNYDESVITWDFKITTIHE